MSRNVEALEQCIRSYRETWSHVPMDTEDARELAEALAARGVLAVDALTDEQCREVAKDPDTVGYDYAEPDQVRAALRRCATGERGIGA